MKLNEFIEFLKDFPQDWDMEFTAPDIEEKESWIEHEYLDVHKEPSRNVVVFSMYSDYQIG